MRENEKMYDFGGAGLLGRLHLDGGQVRHLRHPFRDAAGNIPGFLPLLPFRYDYSHVDGNRPQGSGTHPSGSAGNAKSGCNPNAQGAFTLAQYPDGGQPAVHFFRQSL